MPIVDSSLETETESSVIIELGLARRSQEAYEGPFARDELMIYFEQWHPGTFVGGTISEVLDCDVIFRDGDLYSRVHSGCLQNGADSRLI